MGRLAAAGLVLLAAGCGPKRAPDVDPSLPDDVVREAGDPRVVLEEAAASADPTSRGLGLAWRVRVASPDGLVRWATQGTYDPDPWVQAQVAEALLERLDEPSVAALLGDWVARRSGDPYVRARVALDALAAGHAEVAERARGTWVDQEGWRAAPLALAALATGEESALSAVAAALADTAVRDDDAFFRAVGASGRPELARAAAEGLALAEEETALRLQLARGLLGDPEGAAGWRAFLRAPDPRVQQDALLVVAGLPDDVRGRWVGWARGATDKGVKAAAALLQGPTPAAVGRGLGSDDPFVRWVALEATDALDAADLAPLLARALADDVALIRRRALELAATRGVGAVRGLVGQLQRDPRADVRIVAAGAWWMLDPAAVR